MISPNIKIRSYCEFLSDNFISARTKCLMDTCYHNKTVVMQTPFGAEAPLLQLNSVFFCHCKGVPERTAWHVM